eukprot:CAMPEP_0117761078 /NCGR_PEP_ID=MMETSP0947-20121206/17044_1 /TAXON_ID=44440 /ORGANISM="Chattonella subsalsa, Strain CCMP2191" /LENGTH=289 /DNA_ID=CAMNT_0005581957 /DNA_START=58 /DNA_END=927 /DNA_ORIENTATION=+
MKVGVFFTFINFVPVFGYISSQVQPHVVETFKFYGTYMKRMSLQAQATAVLGEFGLQIEAPPAATPRIKFPDIPEGLTGAGARVFFANRSKGIPMFEGGHLTKSKIARDSQAIYEDYLITLCLRNNKPKLKRRKVFWRRKNQRMGKLFSSGQNTLLHINKLCSALSRSQSPDVIGKEFSLDGRWAVIYDERKPSSILSKLLARRESKEQVIANEASYVMETSSFKLKGLPVKIPILKEAECKLQDGNEEIHCGFGPSRGLYQTNQLVYLGSKLHIVKANGKYAVLVRVK